MPEGLLEVVAQHLHQQRLQQQPRLGVTVAVLRRYLAVVGGRLPDPLPHGGGQLLDAGAGVVQGGAQHIGLVLPGLDLLEHGGQVDQDVKESG